MKIFDLAHKLPTKYMNFINFTRVILELLYKSITDVNWERISSQLKKIIINDTQNKKNNLYSQKDVRIDLLVNNFWFKHFKVCYINDG
jgi:hypothetical protein